MWYDIPRERPEPQQQPKPIFPWEDHRPPPTRVFSPAYVTPPLRKPEVRPEPAKKRPEVRLEPAIKRRTSPPPADSEPEPASPVSSTRSVRFHDEDEEIDIPAAGSPLLDLEEEGTSLPELSVSPQSPEPIEGTPVPIAEYWNASSAANAWDDVPGIRRYIERVIDQTGLGGRRRTEVLRSRMVLDGDSVHLEEGPPPTRQPRHGFFKATDFPGPDERPSLPVTPALPTTPREGWRHSRREEREEEAPREGESPPPRSGPLIEAEGVPRQSEWVCVHGRRWGPRDCLCVLANVLRHHKNPVEQLARLAEEPEELLRRLSEDAEGVPEREFVGSSEGLSGKRGAVRVSEEARAGKTGGGGQAGAGAQEKETPLVAPVPLKRRPADPVGSLEAASSLEGGAAGRTPTFSEVVGKAAGREGEGTAAKGPAITGAVAKGTAAKEGGSNGGAAAAKRTAAVEGVAAKESALDSAARGGATEVLDI